METPESEIIAGKYPLKALMGLIVAGVSYLSISNSGPWLFTIYYNQSPCSHGELNFISFPGNARFALAHGKFFLGRKYQLMATKEGEICDTGQEPNRTSDDAYAIIGVEE